MHILVLASLLILYPYPAATCVLQVSDVERSVVDLVNGSNAYTYAQQLESIGLSYPTYRSAGSIGANQSAQWIAAQLQSLGLQTTIEPFTFKTWSLTTKPTLTIDRDGTPQTTNDQQTIQTFQSQHYSWPTPQNGTFTDLTILPLPQAASREDLGSQPIDRAAWASIDTTGKIVLVSSYVLRVNSWLAEFFDKITAQKPAALIYDSYYDWTPEAQYPNVFSMGSAGGYPLFYRPGLYWELEVPVGAVSYSDGVRMRELEEAEDISANLTIPAQIADGTHLNVAAKLPGQTQPEKQILITAHYDSVLTPGFGDNAAGVAGILELARAFTQAKQKGTYNPPYTLTFIAFTAEELGLIGSAHYLQTHKTEANQITAVLNLDVIGSQDFTVTRTYPTPDLDLDELIVGAATDLGVSSQQIEPGGSDQETFRTPSERAWIILETWRAVVTISDALPVASSALLISLPYSIGESPPGWIHTSYDNSTSTTNYGWITPQKLEEQIMISALSAVRIAPPPPATTTTTTEPTPVSALPSLLSTYTVLYTVLAALITTATAANVSRRSLGKRRTDDTTPAQPIAPSRYSAPLRRYIPR